MSVSIVHKFRFFCLAVAMVPSSAAQSLVGTTENNTLDRHIEVLLRSHFNIPINYLVLIGERKPSQFAGYDALSVTMGWNGKSSTLEFLIAKDNTRLARLEQFDLVNDPYLSIDIAGHPIRGNPHAPVTVIDFDDLECPFCARMHHSLFPKTLETLRG